MSMSSELFPVVPMTLTDLDAVMELEPILFPGDPWARSTYEYELTRNQLSFLRVIHGRTSAEPPLLCYAGVWMLADSAHVVTIGVHPAWQRQGLGGWILLHLIAESLQRQAAEITLEVRKSNRAAQALYAQFGFSVVGRRRRYYRDTGEDALIMTLAEPGSPAVTETHAALRRRLAARLQTLGQADQDNG